MRIIDATVDRYYFIYMLLLSILKFICYSVTYQRRGIYTAVVKQCVILESLIHTLYVQYIPTNNSTTH